MTGVLICNACANIHIPKIHIRCFLKCCFLIVVILFACLFCYWKVSVQHILTNSSKCSSQQRGWCQDVRSHTVSISGPLPRVDNTEWVSSCPSVLAFKHSWTECEGMVLNAGFWRYVFYLFIYFKLILGMLW